MDQPAFSRAYVRDPFNHTSTPLKSTNVLKSAVDNTALWWNNIPLYDRVRKECPALYSHPGMKWMRRTTRIILLTVFVVLAIAAASGN